MKFLMSAVVVVLMSTSAMAETKSNHGQGNPPVSSSAPVAVQPDPTTRFNEIVNACLLQQGATSQGSGRAVGGNVR